MMILSKDNKNQLQFNESQSLFLLGGSSTSTLHERYRHLINICWNLGEFLCYEKHADWLACYAHDSQSLHSKPPLLVFRPHTIQDIPPFIQACHQMQFSVTTRCGGTGLSGSSLPSNGGVVLLTGHLKKIHEYDHVNGIITFEPGLTVKELNNYIEDDHWFFPLSMATEGVAGLAGCLSCHARGYHQQQQAVFDTIQYVEIVDGQGQLLEVPPSLVCGAEGLWGVIVKMPLQLKKGKPENKKFIYSGSWEAVLQQLPLLKSLHCLRYLLWVDDKFSIGIEGESWRLSHAESLLQNYLPGASPLLQAEKLFCSKQKIFVVVTATFYSSQLPEACLWSLELAKELQLECFQQADVLSGSLNLILQSKENSYSFSQKIEQFLVLWANYVADQQGILGNCHGVGKILSSYMTPFWSEEYLQFLKRLQKQFDGSDLFGKDRFFPPLGKSLERVKDHV